ncbi:histidine phosphatase family protein [Amycolatopsis kentuckyensis]|uniref:histidine phosphatase family protein n=1 Tax=Amycolatopsis kentuckyensis TaxID=218823 RepID=UPI001302C0D8|nr:phosphoglycerate mutase family protein [Amycolatopsis kentuckyensis]
MAIHFLRHGESLANEQNLFAGRQDTPLTELGRRQARQAGDRVAALGIRLDEVHVSPLKRARHTADVVAERLREQPGLVVSDALVERDFGVFTARNKSLVKKSIGFRAYTGYFHRSTGCPPGGESWALLHERVRHYYEEVLLPRSRAGKNILVVAHKYVVEMFAVVVAGLAAEDYHDLKIPNARPVSEEDLRRIARGSAKTSAVHDFGELVEIRLPVLVAGGAALGVAAQLAVRVPVPAPVFTAVLVTLLGLSTFFGMLRLHSGVLRGFGPSLRKALPLTALRVGAGLVLAWSFAGGPGSSLALFLLLPPALLTPALSLLWGGDYFASVRQTVVASLVLPVVLLAAAWFPHRLPGLGTAAAGYLAVLGGAMVLPAVAAQVLRRRDPIRAGQLSTNWTWVGGAALVPLAAVATFALTPSDGVDPADLPAPVAAVLATLLVLRTITWLYLRNRTLPPGEARDLFITQCTPNIFLWFTFTGALGHGAALLAPVAAFGFFAAMPADEFVFVRQHRKNLRAATAGAQRAKAAALSRAQSAKVSAGRPSRASTVPVVGPGRSL